MKKALLALVAAALVMIVTGCTAMNFVSDAGTFPADSSTYQVLGRVELQRTSAGSSGYKDLFDLAKKQYPDADDIVNVKVNIQTTRFWFILPFKFNTYELSGIVIKYK